MIRPSTPTDVLLVHTNFPGQFRGVAQYLSGCPEFRVHAIGSRTAAAMPAVNLVRYSVSANDVSGSHALARRFELECRRAEQVMYAANLMRMNGVEPRFIFVHSGWGEAIPLRQIFPAAHIIVYPEYYYRTQGADLGFDPESGQLGVDGAVRVSVRNAATLLAMTEANVAVTPTHWQKSLFPPEFHAKIHVIHDGIDTRRLVPAKARFTDPATNQVFQSGDEVVTYVARNLEPYRGFHVFMRALPRLLKERPNAHVLIAGGDGVSYGSQPEDYESWKAKLLAELGDALDLSRVHLLGALGYDEYMSLLRVSRAHVYLTYPFVLSWSILEAMALGCVVIGSDTQPVREVIDHGVNGLLTPFFDSDALARQVATVLAHPRKHAPLGRAARARVVERYDFESQVLPQYLQLLEESRVPA